MTKTGNDIHVRDSRWNLGILCMLVMVIGVGVIGGMSGCGRAARESNWTLPPPEPVTLSDWTRVRDEAYAPVTEQQRSDAAARLKMDSLIEITRAEAQLLTGKVFAESSAQHLWLVRGVATNPGTGRFIVRLQNHAIWVFHGSLGRNSDEFDWPVVVQLEDRPEQIYVTCDGAV